MRNFTKNSLKILFSGLIISFFTKCGYPEIKDEAPAINKVAKGSEFKIVLPEDHQTGYIWQLKPDFDKNLLENTNVVWHGNAKGVYFNFKTFQKGQATLTFINRKYTDTLNVKTFIITILE